MKKLLFLFALLTVSFSEAQFNDSAPWMKNLNVSSKSSNATKTSNKTNSLYEISDAFNNYWKHKDQNLKGSGYKPFKRWESYWEYFVDKDGNLPTATQLWQTWVNKQNSKIIPNPTSNWTPLGPLSHTVSPGNLPGQGRVNAIAVDPNNTNIWYVGTPAGGIWKSTDAGTTWANLFDEFPQIGVPGIAIDPNNSNIIYITTGDDDAGDSFGVGVFKSIDGGSTWNATGLNPTNSPSSMNEIYIDPTNSTILWVATNRGVYKSIDSGTTWIKKLNQNIKDLKIKPGNSNILYAVTSDSYYKSTDAGDTFTKITSNLPSTSGRLVLAVTKANPEYIYILSSKTTTDDYTYQGIYKSTDSGATFSKTSNTTNILESSQAWFDLAFEASPTNANELYVGCLNIWKSSNGGNTFTKVNDWRQNNNKYTHADIHTLRYFGNTLFACTDGGIYSSTDKGNTFTDKTEGLAISQFYRISVSTKDSNKMIGGLQDNGGHVRHNGQWTNYHGGDGMDNVINPINDNLIYGFTQNGGSLNISANSGATLIASVSAPSVNGEEISGKWITPLAIDRNGEVYAGYNALYKLDGNRWVKKSTANFSDNAIDVEIDPIEPQNIYVADSNKLLKSTDSGVTFTNVSSFTTNINEIEVNNLNNNIIYVSTAVQGQRGIFKSIDGGQNFTNITLNLPVDQPYFTIVHQGRHTKNPIYVGTNLGIYRLDDTLTEWEEYDIGLPNTSIRDLDISFEQGKITAATFGRGIWQFQYLLKFQPMTFN